MELPFGNDPRCAALAAVQQALIGRFGRVERDDPRRLDPVWTLVQGVIGARTKTEISNANTDALLERFGSWEKVAAAPLAELQAMLAGATYPAVAAERLKACLGAIIAERGEVSLMHLSNLPTHEAMDWLETLPGVARKISAGVMNTSRFARPVLVIDGHHRRVMQRLGLVPPRSDTRRAYDALMSALPPDWSAGDVDEHHLLVKKLGQTTCRPSRPDCAGCPLREQCPTGRAGAR
ncbi:endonuclease III domain-containing protein [Sphingomicrobium flavum]|uniref:endonuclease III domain-containing protein n=1 Tax=Sphingomicrobium flavum TaxID=1229164 RepID=UPI0021ADFFAD|nr:endonuclease III [Sphingomicrobium flavum]